MLFTFGVAIFTSKVRVPRTWSDSRTFWKGNVVTQKIEFGATKLLHMDYSKRLHYAKINICNRFHGGNEGLFLLFCYLCIISWWECYITKTTRSPGRPLLLFLTWEKHSGKSAWQSAYWVIIQKLSSRNCNAAKLRERKHKEYGVRQYWI
jgi:hypothetical protein